MPRMRNPAICICNDLVCTLLWSRRHCFAQGCGHTFVSFKPIRRLMDYGAWKREELDTDQFRRFSTWVKLFSNAGATRTPRVRIIFWSILLDAPSEKHRRIMVTQASTPQRVDTDSEKSLSSLSFLFVCYQRIPVHTWVLPCPS